MNHGFNTERTRKKNLLYEELTFKIIGAAKEAYYQLGGGLLESVYEDALCYELAVVGINFKRQEWIDVFYKDTVFEHRFRADIVVDQKILVENKALTSLSPVDKAQLLNYLKLTHLKVGLLFKFSPDKFKLLRRVL